MKRVALVKQNLGGRISIERMAAGASISTLPWLPFLLYRDWFHQARQRHAVRLSPVQDRLDDDGRRQQREA